MKTDTLKLKIAVLAVSSIVAGNSVADSQLASLMRQVKDTFTETFTIVDNFTDKGNKQKLAEFTKRMNSQLAVINRIIGQLKAELEKPETRANSTYIQIIQAMLEFSQQTIYSELSNLYTALESFRTSANSKKVVELAAVLKTQMARFGATQNFEQRLNNIHALLLENGQTQIANDVKTLIATAHAKIAEIKKKVEALGASFLVVLKQRI